VTDLRLMRGGGDFRRRHRPAVEGLKASYYLHG
jgi:hypothetical protein